MRQPGVARRFLVRSGPAYPVILRPMYASHFGFDKEPFSIAPDPRFLYLSERHREALAHLLYGLSAGGGFVLLTGEIGAGKTTVCRGFLEQVPKHSVVAYIFNPKLTVRELLHTVCEEFAIELPATVSDTPLSLKSYVDALNTFLLRLHAQGRQAVLVIDEAQSLDIELLEQLRLLTNLETTERKLLQIILIGQPELRDLLARPELKQLAQRVIARYHLEPLAANETPQYLRHRLLVAGLRAHQVFEPAAMARIHHLAGGVPRKINLLADRALLGAYGQGRALADVRIVEQAAREVFGVDAVPHQPLQSAQRWPQRWQQQRQQQGWLPWAAGAALLGGLALVVWSVLGPGRAKAPLAAVTGPASHTASAPASASAFESASESASAPASAPAPAPASAFASASAASSEPSSARVALARATPAAPAFAAALSTPAERARPEPLQAADNGEWLAYSDDPSALLAAAVADAGLTWRELALRWHVAVGDGDACETAQQAALSCYRSGEAGGGLTLVRQLMRPGVVVLRDAQGRTRHALLVGLGDRHAVLQVGSQRFGLTLQGLATAWRGDFHTLWKTPPGWREGRPALADASTRSWLLAQLQAPPDTDAASLSEKLRIYQVAHGLQADGQLGPLTLMRMNRGAGVEEPRLPVVVAR